jgi:hypothetical protein
MTDKRSGPLMAQVKPLVAAMRYELQMLVVLRLLADQDARQLVLRRRRDLAISVANTVRLRSGPLLAFAPDMPGNPDALLFPLLQRLRPKLLERVGALAAQSGASVSWLGCGSEVAT